LRFVISRPTLCAIRRWPTFPDNDNKASKKSTAKVCTPCFFAPL
jgi:hypothetical protein